MKVLYCHNYYRVRGGEDVSFEGDVEMLRAYGHEVVTVTRDNADIDRVGRLRQVRDAFWSADAERETADLIRRERPDVLHCNNLFPRISPSVYRAANRAGVPVVQAVRNYRYFCPAATLMRDGAVCTDCLHKRFAYPAIRHGCYRESRTASGVVAAVHAYHRLVGTAARRVAAFFTPSDFARRVVVDGGLPSERVHVRTNSVYPDHGEGEGRGGFALFVGRISPEKGVDTLIEAWRRHAPSVPLKVVGEDVGDRLRRSIDPTDRIELCGRQSHSQVLDLMGRATCLVFPSRWYETFGRTIAEAFSRGTPVVSSDLGVMSELIDDGESGFLFPPGDAAKLAAAVVRIAADADRAGRMRAAARRAYEARFTRQHGYDQLLDVYRAAGVAVAGFQREAAVAP